MSLGLIRDIPRMFSRDGRRDRGEQGTSHCTLVRYVRRGK